jgi:pimeloyl-ACP methyl ester carboxylesterase
MTGATSLTVEANGLDVGYEVQGVGPPMILLHAATSTAREDFAPQIPLFSKAFRCYLPDARGHGRTRWDAGRGFTTEMLVTDLLAFAGALTLETFHVVGFSMGAMTALTFASRYPDRVRTLIIVGITTQREPRASVARKLMDPAWIDENDAGRVAVLARRHDEHQGIDAWRRLLPAIAEDVRTQPLLSPRDLRRIEAPALVAVGDRDPFTPVDHAWGVSRSLPDGRLLVVPDCPHEVLTRRPAIFNEAASTFYRSTEGVARRRASVASGESPESVG